MSAVAQIGTAAGGAQVGFSTGNGIADPRAVFALSCPFMIESGESFNVTPEPRNPVQHAGELDQPSGSWHDHLREAGRHPVPRRAVRRSSRRSRKWGGAYRLRSVFERRESLKHGDSAKDSSRRARHARAVA